MAKNIAYLYSHGGEVFDGSQPEGFTIRGRNIFFSIKSAIASGADRVFVSEAVYPDKTGQIRALMASGKFGGLEKHIDVSEYHVGKGVPFPKNYLFNRGAQRARDFFGLVFSDSDVLYKPGFPSRALSVLKSYEFAQPDAVLFLDPTCSREQYRANFTMKSANTDPRGYKSAILWLPGEMPGMVNIVRRDKFLEIGGFSQAISGVNWEDMEYQYRLKMLGKQVGFIPDEHVLHMFHPRDVKFAKKEGTGSMYLVNLNFMCWWVSHLRIAGNSFDHRKFEEYMKIIKASLDANSSVGAYVNLTGSIIPQFNPDMRYRNYMFGQPEPYTDWNQPKEMQCEAILWAAEFWRVSPEEILRLSKSYNRAFTVSLGDVLEHQKKRSGHSEGELDDLFNQVLSEDEADRIFEEALEGDDNLDKEFERAIRN